jgi:hypothetical protein
MCPKTHRPNVYRFRPGTCMYLKIKRDSLVSMIRPLLYSVPLVPSLPSVVCRPCSKSSWQYKSEFYLRLATMLMALNQVSERVFLRLLPRRRMLGALIPCPYTHDDLCITFLFCRGSVSNSNFSHRYVNCLRWKLLVQSSSCLSYNWRNAARRSSFCICCYFMIMASTFRKLMAEVLSAPGDADVRVF